MSADNINSDNLNAIMSKAHEKLAAAQRELSGGFYGEAASRAYYAVFHALSAVLATQGLSFSSHSQTIGGFNKHFVKTATFPQDTTRKLQRLFEDRQIADYDWINTVDAETAEEDVKAAEDIVAECVEYISNKSAS